MAMRDQWLGVNVDRFCTLLATWLSDEELISSTGESTELHVRKREWLNGTWQVQCSLTIQQDPIPSFIFRLLYF
jgi:hypothetical protein